MFENGFPPSGNSNKLSFSSKLHRFASYVLVVVMSMNQSAFVWFELNQTIKLVQWLSGNAIRVLVWFKFLVFYIVQSGLTLRFMLFWFIPFSVYPVKFVWFQTFLLVNS